MFVASALIFAAFQVKNDKIFRLLFVFSGIFAGTHFMLLGATTAAVVVLINGSRWLVSIFSRSRHWFWVYIFLLCISLFFTYSSPISLVAFLAGILGTVAVFHKEQFSARKILMGIDMLWIANNILIFTPIGVISHVLFFLSGLVGYKRLKKF